MLRKIIFHLLLIALLAACARTQETAPTLTATQQPSTALPTFTQTQPPTETSTPQPHLITQDYGPELEDFPSNVNPLTGREVQDPSLLELPAVMVSPLAPEPALAPAIRTSSTPLKVVGDVFIELPAWV